jgi:YVTN family beta-propeller protein
MNNTLLSGVALAALTTMVGCTGSSPILEDTRYQTGSRTMVADDDYDALYQVNVDEGSVSIVPTDGSEMKVLDLGAGSEPTRIVRVGNQAWVTLRGTGEVAVLAVGPAGFEEVTRIPVGTEPHGIVASEDGRHVYVTLSVENKVVHIDPATTEVTSTVDVPGDPRWLALHPNGRHLYVAGARSRVVYDVHTDEETGDPDGTVDVVELPVTTREVDGIVYEPTPRLMGDIAIDPFGEALVVPSIYVDNHSQQPGLLPTQDPTTGYYVNPLPGLGRFNSALVTIPLKPNGTPVEADAKPIFLASFIEQDFVSETIRSYPNSVSVSPDGYFYAVSMESSDAVVMVGALDYDRGATHDFWIQPVAADQPGRHNYTEHPHSTIALLRGSGPRGVAWLDDDQAWVHNWMDVSATNLDPASAMERVEQRGTHGLDDVASDSARAQLQVEMDRDRTVFHNGSPEANRLRAGRDLFYGARNADMQAVGSGVSCSTCHFEGRDDGLTWQLGPERRQTPSLAGRVTETHPVTWTDDIESVAAEAELTSTIRMGGFALSQQDYQDIEAFVDWTRPVRKPVFAMQDPLVAQGEEIFNRPEVGCAECHIAESAFTDGRHHTMYGLDSVNTPSLRGIAATAPYLHDGSAPTLRDVLESARGGEMGNTSSLSDSEMDALEAYLIRL